MHADEAFRSNSNVHTAKTTLYNIMNAEEWYKEGNLRRKRQDWQGALNCYQEAIDLDSKSPAVHARKMLMEIIEFYNKDMYNP